MAAMICNGQTTGPIDLPCLTLHGTVPRFAGDFYVRSGRSMRIILSIAACLVLILLAVGASVDPAGSAPLAVPTVHRVDVSGSSAATAPVPLRVASTADSPAPQPSRRAQEVLEAIQKRHGEPLPGYVGGRPFENRERALPPGRYREYDVHPKIPGRNRGPERLVIERRTGKAYYTRDHYVTFIPMN
jgi:ribonuclease T1